MLLVILGAGASFDCAPLYPAKDREKPESRMPLTNDLFGKTDICTEGRKAYTQILPILSRLTNLATGH